MHDGRSHAFSSEIVRDSLDKEARISQTLVVFTVHAKNAIRIGQSSLSMVASQASGYVYGYGRLSVSISVIRQPRMP